MNRSEPFTALIVACFGLASYADGSLWTSGFCVGLAAAMLFDFTMTELSERKKRSAHSGDHQ